MLKQDFGPEKYLWAISASRYRIAISKLRTYNLEIERGRYTKSKTDLSKRLRPVCYTIVDEVHFRINFKLYESERQHVFPVINENRKTFQSLNDVENCIFLMSNPSNQFIAWVDKFIYECFQARFEFVLKQRRHVYWIWPLYFVPALGIFPYIVRCVDPPLVLLCLAAIAEYIFCRYYYLLSLLLSSSLSSLSFIIIIIIFILLLLSLLLLSLSQRGNAKHQNA